MILKMTAEEYDGVIKYLLSLPMSKADKPMLAHLYAGGGIPEVLGETSKELRARVAMNAVKAHCDTKKTPHRRQPITGAWKIINHHYHITLRRKCQMKKSEVKKMQALSIRRDDAVSDENWFAMMQDIFQGYETALALEQAVFQDAEEEAEEVCKRG